MAPRWLFVPYCRRRLPFETGAPPVVFPDPLSLSAPAFDHPDVRRLLLSLAPKVARNYRNHSLHPVLPLELPPWTGRKKLTNGCGVGQEAWQLQTEGPLGFRNSKASPYLCHKGLERGHLLRRRSLPGVPGGRRTRCFYVVFAGQRYCRGVNLPRLLAWGRIEWKSLPQPPMRAMRQHLWFLRAS